MGGDKRLLEDPNFNSKGEDHQEVDEDDDEEEEALSLCDLPIIVTNGENCQQKSEVRPLVTDHDFEFGSSAASTLTESADQMMCAAEDVFFQGQILPLRLSVSSENCLSSSAGSSARLESRNPSNRCGSRSDSMERCSSSSGGFSTSCSSRSSSSRSHNSSCSSMPSYKPKVRNLFHSHPSPKPQVWFSGTSGRPKKNPSTRNSRSTIWGLFRPGLVQTPEIELQQYSKLNRNSKSFNSSSTSSSIQSSISCSNMERNKSGSNKAKLERKKQQRHRVNVFDGCKCSVEAIGTVSSRVVVLKNSKKNKKVNGKEGKEEKTTTTTKKKKNHNDDQKQRKEALYHKRTFEWLKELSLADVLDEGVQEVQQVPTAPLDRL